MNRSFLFMQLMPLFNPFVKPRIKWVLFVCLHLLIPSRTLKIEGSLDYPIKYLATDLFDNCIDNPFREDRHSCIEFSVDLQ